MTVIDTDKPWTDTSRPPQERARALVAAMTLEQKIAQLHGSMETIDIYGISEEMGQAETAEEMDRLAAQIKIERHVAGIEELGIPRFRITNGPVGVGMGDGYPSPKATSLPMSIGLAAGFDPRLAHDYGDIIGSETASLGQHVLEGPGVCLHRLPTAGRNFEYFSEDPYLSGVMGVEVTRAIQDHDVIAMGKHYVVNDQENERFRTDVEVDEDVLRELYLLPFEMLVKDGDIAAIMSAYNRVRGTYATENRYTLTTILRQEWGFQGYVQSDFWSTRSAAASLGAGLDHEMPDAKWLNEDNVKAALADHSLEIGTIDRALVRRYTQMFRFGQFERPYDPQEIDAQGHGAISRRIGTEIAILLKNEDATLPLSKDTGRILVVGQRDFAGRACLGGGGSSRVDPLYTVDPVDGFRDVIEALGGSATVEGLVVEEDLSNLEAVSEAAAEADVVVAMVGIIATEGADRPDVSLPLGQDRIVEAAVAANPRTVVVLKDSSPVLMPWIDSVPAVLEAWNQGAEDGHAVADLLLGVVNPSGKVPTTYPRREEDVLAAGDPVRYPGTDEGEGWPTIRYTERHEVGYRWYQARGIEPLFPFGFGLSYTTFELSEVSVETGARPGTDPITVRATVANTGGVAGAEVVQVYVGLPAELGRPPRRLVGFAKVRVEPGASEQVEMVVDPAATHHPLSVWSDAAHAFVTPAGEYTLYIGTSSEDTPFRRSFTLTD
ncbi:beta-glucosidase [Raineyella fluvialis]|uniref:Glycosyl hydrolase n=1 Tax=Raineyella fluvialis TaxID=2662261 RepID=A0A5Q2FDR8_9ACTN|nr:glycoside hydrolase family 3 C-terminal domain-containing protein [Raineyella fluvialis]QGF23927.1 glycosyl hydrolase [Raineyella fluvialis]